MAIGTGATLLYSVPAGRTFRGLLIATNDSAAAVQVWAGVGGAATAQLVYKNAINVNNSVAATIILNPGDDLYVRFSAAAGCAAVLVGSLLLGSPS